MRVSDNGSVSRFTQFWALDHYSGRIKCKEKCTQIQQTFHCLRPGKHMDVPNISTYIWLHRKGHGKTQAHKGIYCTLRWYKICTRFYKLNQISSINLAHIYIPPSCITLGSRLFKALFVCFINFPFHVLGPCQQYCRLTFDNLNLDFGHERVHLK